MERRNIEAGVTEVVRKLLGMPADQAISPETDFKTELGTDSLFDAEFGMEVEDRFEIEVPDDVRPRNIREATDAILAARAKNTARAG
jgi:acyl carrier protein